MPLAINCCLFSHFVTVFLSPVEQAYLSGTREFTKPQIRYIRCRLKKKLRLLDEELKLSGILNSSSSGVAANTSGSVAASCNGLENLPPPVAQPAERRLMLENETSSPRRDLNARPKVFAATLELERRFTKPSLCRLSY